MSYIETNKKSFGSVAKEYKKYRGSYNTTLFKLLISFIRNDKKSISILDLGCGVGNSTEPIYLMAKKLKTPTSVFGIDPDKAMLEEAKKSAKKNKFPIQYLQGQAEKLPFENETFDLIISGASFHWFANEKAIKEIKRVLKPKGSYCVFWTQSIEKNKPVVGRELYKKYGFQGIPKELRDPGFVKNILLKFGFSKVIIKKVPYVQTKSNAEAIGLIKTNSGYATLSPADKKDFIKAMTLEYKKAFGAKNHRIKQVINVCCGSK